MKRKEFVKQAAQIIWRAIDFSDFSTREGLLALTEHIDCSKADYRDIFEFGMQFVVEAQDPEDINKILSNLINQEQNENAKRLKTIQKEAVLNIVAGTNTRMLMEIMFSYVDNEELKEIRKNFNFLGEDESIDFRKVEALLFKKT
ncbi:MAG: hypothetical protein FWB99_05140 [Treponema sp.]|nr:hypothetical protein [Treponema sp.]